MQYNPHEYQKYAIDFIETHPQAAVLLECGLGKTSITLTALNDMLFDSFDVHVAMSQNYMKQANQIWNQIFQIVRENCSVEFQGNSQDDMMENLLRGRK